MNNNNNNNNNNNIFQYRILTIKIYYNVNIFDILGNYLFIK